MTHCSGMTPADTSASRSPRVTLTIVVSRKVRNSTASTVVSAARREGVEPWARSAVISGTRWRTSLVVQRRDRLVLARWGCGALEREQPAEGLRGDLPLAALPNRVSIAVRQQGCLAAVDRELHLRQVLVDYVDVADLRRDVHGGRRLALLVQRRPEGRPVLQHGHRLRERGVRVEEDLEHLGDLRGRSGLRPAPGPDRLGRSVAAGAAARGEPRRQDEA